MPRTWLITGASCGLGHALAGAVLADGQQLVSFDLDELARVTACTAPR